MRAFWPPAERVQITYEQLRQAVLTDTPLLGPEGLRFDRSGFLGLMTATDSEVEFTATLIGALRPAWSPHRDVRLDTLGAAYALLLRSTPTEALTSWEVG